MNIEKWVKLKIAAKIQSTILVALMAAPLGIAGWLLGNTRMAMLMIAALLILYWISPTLSPAFL